MITLPTVLVLGAGASYPYGFPTAAMLKWQICQEFQNADTQGGRLLGGNSNHSPGEFVEFRNALSRSGQKSVDAFLEHRREFLEVGKLAIAYCLIPFETEDALFQGDPNCGGRGGDWYEYLFDKLNASFEEFGQNKLSVITFNYDRSLEYFLLTSLQHSHGKTFNQCADLLMTSIRQFAIGVQFGSLAFSNVSGGGLQSGCTVFVDANLTVLCLRLRL